MHVVGMLEACSWLSGRAQGTAHAQGAGSSAQLRDTTAQVG